MTWRLIERGDVGGTVRLEYLCPVHGRFEADVSRVGGPDVVACPVLVEHDHRCEDPPCSDCGFTLWRCDEPSPWSPSGVLARVKLGEVTQGKFESQPHAAMLDTRAIADGMPLGEWKAKRAAIRQDERRKKNKAAMR